VKDRCRGGKIAATEAMKYYIYISDAKVDMLFPQVPHEIKKKVATEFKMDLKLLSASRKTETESEDNRIARLEAVVDFVREYGNLGTVDKPDQYVEDILPMRWGPYEDGLVYFGALTEQTTAGLGGSLKHVMGNNEGESMPFSHSATPALVKVLSKELKLQDQQHEHRSRYAESTRDEAKIAVELATEQMEGPLQTLDFLAKRLLYWEAIPPSERFPAQKCVLLATPLYVAMTD
jgi:hypothetical protein